MSRRLTPWLALAALLAAFALSAVPSSRAFAQDSAPDKTDKTDKTDTSDETIETRRKRELLRRMDRGGKEKLQRALARFDKLPASEQAKLRRRASDVGHERLRELHRARSEHGHDVGKLRKRHAAMKRERDEVITQLGGAKRFASLTDGERRYIEHVAIRRYGGFMLRALMNIRNPDMYDSFRKLTRDERKERMTQARDEAVKTLLVEESDEYRTQFAQMNDKERRAASHVLFREFRRRHISDFAAGFDREFLVPFLRRPAAERAEAVGKMERRVRWFEVRRVLRKELRISSDTIAKLASLRADQAARVRDVFEKGRAEKLSKDDLRMRVEKKIHELYGEDAKHRPWERDDNRRRRRK